MNARKIKERKIYDETDFFMTFSRNCFIIFVHNNLIKTMFYSLQHDTTDTDCFKKRVKI